MIHFLQVALALVAAGLIYADTGIKDTLNIPFFKNLRPSLGWFYIPFVVLVTGIPHYGATLLRVFARAEARRRYAWWAFGAGALVWGAFLAGSRVAWVGAWLITLYLSWSPWHYAAQNFGLALMFLLRENRTGGFLDRLPAPGDIDRLSYRFVAAGFIMYGLMIVSGSL